MEAPSTPARVVAVKGPRSLSEIMADPNSRLRELGSLLLLSGRLERAREAANGLPPIVDELRRARLAKFIQEAIIQVELALEEHAAREKSQ